MSTDLEAERREHRAETIQGLRELAGFLEAHPQIPLPVLPTYDAIVDDIAVLRAATHLTGKWEKHYLQDWVARAKVCRRVQTGTKHVDAVEAHDEPVFDWVCDDDPEAPAEADLAEAGAS